MTLFFSGTPRASRLATALGLALFALGSLSPSTASACSPPFTPPGEVCEVVRVWTPGAMFPMNLADTDVRVILELFDGRTTGPRSFDPMLTLSVARVTDTGFEIVDHTLGTMDGLLTDTRLLEITDPVPGRYVVASPDHACEAEPASFAEGSVVADFVLTEEVPLPADLGAATWLGQSVADERISMGTNADCSPVTEIQRIARSRFRLDLSEQALPWAQALRYGIEVDGVQTSGFGVGEFDEPSVITFEHQLRCPAEDGLTPGPHTLRFLGQVDGTTVASSSVDFELSCGEPAAEDQGGGSCSVSRRPQGMASLLLLAAAGALRWRLRRRARS